MAARPYCNNTTIVCGAKSCASVQCACVRVSGDMYVISNSIEIRILIFMSFECVSFLFLIILRKLKTMGNRCFNYNLRSNILIVVFLNHPYTCAGVHLYNRIV